MTEFWMESNDEDELRAGCDCGWLGEWRDFGRDAMNDGDDHLATAHPAAEEAS